MSRIAESMGGPIPRSKTLWLLVALFILMGAAGVARAAQGLDYGKPGPGELWAPGQILVRFNDGVKPRQRARIVRTAHVAVVYELPLVPNLYEVKTRGSVTAALGRLGDQRGVEYAQPNYIETESLDAAPSQAAYWPNDPYFWPTKREYRRLHGIPGAEWLAAVASRR